MFFIWTLHQKDDEKLSNVTKTSDNFRKLQGKHSWGRSNWVKAVGLMPEAGIKMASVLGLFLKKLKLH